MAKHYVQSVSDKAVLFTDDKGNTETFDLIVPMAKNEIVGTLSKEITGRGDVTRACLTVMLEMLDSPRVDTYRGQTATGGKVPKELKKAVEEMEVSTFQPMFYAYWDAKNKAPDAMDSTKSMAHMGRRAAQWDTFIGAQRDGGLYGNVKTYSLQYFAYFGKLPCVYDGDKPQKEKLMPTSAMAKAIAIAKAANITPGLTGIAKMLQEVKDALQKGTVTDADAQASFILATEVTSILKGMIDKIASDATAKAQGLPPTGAALQDGDKVQAPEKSLADMAKLALDKAAIKPAKGKIKLTHQETIDAVKFAEKPAATKPVPDALV